MFAAVSKLVLAVNRAALIFAFSSSRAVAISALFLRRECTSWKSTTCSLILATIG